MANFNFNKVILGGRLTADPELRQTPQGVAVTSFDIAVNKPYSKDKEQQADYFRCVAWRGTAEFISKYFKKGSSICVEGSLQNRSWVDQQSGQKRYATDVVVSEANFVDGKNDNAQATAPAYTAPAYTAPADVPNFETLADDEELPF